MKLQISFDLPDLDKALEIAKSVVNFCDRIEIGTILIYKYGIEAIRRFKEELPDSVLLADTKMVDRSRDIVTHVFAKTSVQWLTVMAGTSSDVIHTACTAAHDANKKVMLDLLDSKSLGQSALDAQNLGADALMYHQPYEEEKSLVFLEQWDMIRGNSSLPIFVSAHINRDIIEQIIAIKPNGIVIGRAITHAEDPAAEAQYFHEICSKN